MRSLGIQIPCQRLEQRGLARRPRGMDHEKLLRGDQPGELRKRSSTGTR